MSQLTKPPVGSLIVIPNPIGRGARLGLVVNQEVGARWIAKDPFPPHKSDLISDPLIVRLLGTYIDHAWHRESNGQWGQEPVRFQTARWAYVQTNPNPPQVLAGPDTHSIERFFGACSMCNVFSTNPLGLTFMGELQLLLDHLKGRQKEADETGAFERCYRAMLTELLPPQN